MNLKEKMEKELEKVLSEWGVEKTTSLTWKTGFRSGFRRGYDLACEEAAGGFKEIQKRIKKVRIKAENILKES